MSDGPAVFDAGVHERVGENTVWHWQGWATPEGAIRLPIDRDHAIIVKADGTTWVVRQ